MEKSTASYHDPDARYGIDPDAEPTSEMDRLDSPELKELADRIYNWWYETRISSTDNRHEQAIDDDFVDGLQWFDEDAQVLAERHQQPLVFNEIKPAVEWVVGTEKRTRIDWAVKPRTDNDVKMAEVKTKLLKYVSDVNKAEFARSKAFASAVTNGIGWLEIGIKGDQEDEPVFVRNESWRNMWIDHLSVENDLSDARYIMRSKVMELDIAEAMFPNRKYALKNASEALDRMPYQSEDDFFDSQLYYGSDNSPVVKVDDALGYSQERREVVRLIEVWYKEPVNMKICRCGDAQFSGKEFKPDDPEMAAALEQEHFALYDAVRMKIRVAVFIEGGSLLQEMASPYTHNRFPFVPVWGYRRNRDNQPYGIVRNQRDPQMDLNKRRSKALFLLSVNRTIMDEDAVPDLDEYEEEVARPDAIIVKKAGKTLEIETHVQLAEEHLQMAREDGEYIRQVSGVTGENLGQETNAVSGKAITARQNQGTVVTASLFDNMRLTVQLSGEIMLSLIEQFYTDEKVVRITGDHGVNEFLNINQYDYETGEYQNDITTSQSDFVVSEQDYRESIREAMFEQMMEMVGKLDPETALNMLDLVFEFSDFAGKDEMVKRIRKLNGQTDPKDPDAEAIEDQREQQEAQAAQQEQELTMREALAKIKSLEAKATSDESGSLVKAMDARIKAMELAIAGMHAPHAALVGEDTIETEKLKLQQPTQ